MPTPLLPSLQAVCLALLSIAALPAYAQLPEGRWADSNRHLWLNYQGAFRVAERWDAYAEVLLRRAEFGDKPQENLLRLAADYRLCKAITLSGGYAHQLSYPYGDFPATDRTREHRLYQQALLRDDNGSVHVQHRYRLEQRWIRWPQENASTFQNRVRYQLRLAVPLLGKQMVPGMPYVVAADELMLNFGRNIQSSFFDQNRLYAGLGYVVSKTMSFEGGYLNQMLRQRNGRVMEHNHTLQLSVVMNLDMRPEDGL